MSADELYGCGLKHIVDLSPAADTRFAGKLVLVSRLDSTRLVKLSQVRQVAAKMKIYGVVSTK